jgi:hypothetical protein
MCSSPWVSIACSPKISIAGSAGGSRWGQDEQQAGGAVSARGDQGKPFVGGVQYRPHLIDGCLAGTGPRIEPW